MASLQLQEAFAAFDNLQTRRPQYNSDMSPSRLLAFSKEYDRLISEFEYSVIQFRKEIAAGLLSSTSDKKAVENLESDRDLCLEYLEGLKELEAFDASTDLQRLVSRKPRQFRLKMLNGMSRMRLADHRLRVALEGLLAEINLQLGAMSSPPDPWPPQISND